MSLSDPFLVIQRMQMAVDVVLSSEHETSKVAASIFNPAAPDIPAIAQVNHRPSCLKSHFAWDARLGTSSQFVHAEMAAISAFKGPLKGAHICVTDPFCPNCAKCMAEAGVRTIYIDHKGFQKDFIARNESEFQSMSMLIAEKAGISVYMVNRKEAIVTPILEQAALTRPTPSSIEFYDLTPNMTIESVMATFRKRFGAREMWSTAFVREADGSPRGILVFEALPPGITPDDYVSRGTTDTGKYRFPLASLTRLMLSVKRMGFTYLDPRVGCSHSPSARAIVNALGFGIDSLILASGLSDHDSSGLDAIDILKAKSLLHMEEIP